jgi:hypothetical protein
VLGRPRLSLTCRRSITYTVKLVLDADTVSMPVKGATAMTLGSILSRPQAHGAFVAPATGRVAGAPRLTNLGTLLGCSESAPAERQSFHCLGAASGLVDGEIRVGREHARARMWLRHPGCHLPLLNQTHTVLV